MQKRKKDQNNLPFSDMCNICYFQSRYYVLLFPAKKKNPDAWKMRGVHMRTYALDRVESAGMPP